MQDAAEVADVPTLSAKVGPGVEQDPPIAIRTFDSKRLEALRRSVECEAGTHRSRLAPDAEVRYLFFNVNSRSELVKDCQNEIIPAEGFGTSVKPGKSDFAEFPEL